MQRTTLMSRPNNEARMFRTVVVSALGLLPVGIVSGMMLMQIFGVWTY